MSALTFAPALLSPKGLYLRPEFFELADYSPESVHRVRQANGEQTLGVAVGADVAKSLDSAAVGSGALTVPAVPTTGDSA